MDSTLLPPHEFQVLRLKRLEKGKSCPCPRHKGIQGEKTYCSSYSSPRHQVAIVNFTPPPSRTLYPIKACRCPLFRNLGGPQRRLGRCWSRENRFLGVEPRTVHTLAIRFPDYQISSPLAIPAVRTAHSSTVSS